MAEHYFELSREDQSEVLEQARESTGRPTHLLEKDAWVVWTLSALFESPLSENLTFKGGTSLSKVYKVINRFSEDIDLTYDIRKLIGDFTGDEEFLPPSRSQAKKWTEAVRDRLPGWINSKVLPILQAALEKAKMEARLEIAGEQHDKLLVCYPAIKQGTGYVAPIVTLEFGARATGEPHHVLPVTCDMEGYVEGVNFPKASPLVMGIARTFWEKATATHVYCVQGRIRGERYARHWHDLVAIMHSTHFDDIIKDHEVARAVAAHKAIFFPEKDSSGGAVDYEKAVDGMLKIVPEGEARESLAQDYAKMLEDQVMIEGALPFDDLMDACSELMAIANAVGKAGSAA